MLPDSLQALLLNEQKELNEWNRSVSQIYFTWYTVFLTLNGAGLGWVFEKTVGAGRPDLKPGIVVFALWNILSIVTTIGVIYYVRSSNARIQMINDLITEEMEDGDIRVKSPLPASASMIAYCSNVIALAALFTPDGVVRSEAGFCMVKLLVSAEGLEPSTHALKGHCSTN